VKLEPVYTLDADLVMVAACLPALRERLEADGFRIEEHPHPVNATGLESELRIQFTTDERYEDFPSRGVRAEALGASAKSHRCGM
jgi:hypothetical protein